jgi:MFS family permease
MEFLIITRVLQGVGAALLTPGSLAILEASFRPADRARAIGAWSGLGGIAVAAGPLVGGYLIAAASWRWIFFINVPIAALVIVLSARHVPESLDPGAGGRTDYLGAAAVAVFLSGITFAFTEAPALGWSSPAVLTMALLGVIALALFLTWERHAASPMLPLVGAGLALLTLAPSGPSYARYVFPAVVVFGLGLAITVAPLTATAMSSAPADHAGIASAVNNDVARFGGLLAVAVLPALAGITGTAYLHPDALAAGFRTAVLISAALCAAGGLLAAVMITDPVRGQRGAAVPEQCLHCGLDAPPLTTTTGQVAGTG